MVKNQNKLLLEPAIFVIFGITGDLSRHKLLPALYHLIKDGLLHEDTEIVGISRRDVSAKELLENVELCVNEIDKVCDPVVLKKMQKMLSMQQIDLDKGADYDKLKAYLDSIEDKHKVCMNRLFYLSIPPKVYLPIVHLLGDHNLNDGCQHGTAASRLLVEKPFGYDLKSAEELISKTEAVFHENQVFRIDHYVAKETVQNIMTLRFKNEIFDKNWSGEQISHIQISASERIGIEGRVAFYESTGALRDFIQSHLLQLMAIVTMEQPKDGASDSLHAAKLDLLKSVVPISLEKVSDQSVRGQYEGYRDEVDNPDSKIETFAAIKLMINNNRWRNVPILIRTGKRLQAVSEKVTEINLIFGHEHDNKNILKIRIQPNEGIDLSLQVKHPGYEDEIRQVDMAFNYAEAFEQPGHPDAYERVLVDAVRGDHTLFATSAEVLASWKIIDNVEKAWQRDSNQLIVYKQGSFGPKQADELASKAGTQWL